jgi:gamma-glutamylcyclotransferase (GGCT)/AIG2-like uncharacterized protein YtfP
VSTEVFVYGTLKPGQHRWPVLAPFTLGDGAVVSAAAPGRLFDTGYGWPAAVFDPRTAGRVPGVVVGLHPASTDQALAVLDDVEGVDSGLFRRILIDVEGRPCWAYHWPGETGEFRRITFWR